MAAATASAFADLKKPLFAILLLPSKSDEIIRIIYLPVLLFAKRQMHKPQVIGIS
ncbi:MAG: hypothetical protein GXP03_00580 [Alphaproteobacteria bacterium]|nr:hypothetical protein [Alphaproteobacteria bacterium]